MPGLFRLCGSPPEEGLELFDDIDLFLKTGKFEVHKITRLSKTYDSVNSILSEAVSQLMGLPRVSGGNSEMEKSMDCRKGTRPNSAETVSSSDSSSSHPEFFLVNLIAESVRGIQSCLNQQQSAALQNAAVSTRNFYDRMESETRAFKTQFIAGLKSMIAGEKKYSKCRIEWEALRAKYPTVLGTGAPEDFEFSSQTEIPQAELMKIKRCHSSVLSNSEKFLVHYDAALRPQIRAFQASEILSAAVISDSQKRVGFSKNILAGLIAEIPENVQQAVLGFPRESFEGSTRVPQLRSPKIADTYLSAFSSKSFSALLTYLIGDSHLSMRRAQRDWVAQDENEMSVKSGDWVRVVYQEKAAPGNRGLNSAILCRVGEAGLGWLPIEVFLERGNRSRSEEPAGGSQGSDVKPVESIPQNPRSPDHASLSVIHKRARLIRLNRSAALLIASRSDETLGIALGEHFRVLSIAEDNTLMIFRACEQSLVIGPVPLGLFTVSLNNSRSEKFD